MLVVVGTCLLFFGRFSPGWSFILSPRQTIVPESCCSAIKDGDGTSWWSSAQESTTTGGNSSSQNVTNMLNPSKKQQVFKRQQGEAASAAMDLPSQPVVTTLNGGSDLLFRMVRQQVVPRWHPTSTTTSDAATSQRKKQTYQQPAAPIEARAAATTIWKNARKRNKPSLWRYAIRTLERLPPSQRKNEHYEGTLVAAAKLGWSEQALSIYETVRDQQTTSSTSLHLTDNMMLSLVKACVGDALRSKDRAILDKIVQILQQYELTTAAHWNPVAAAYRKLSHYDVAREVLALLPAPHEGHRFNVQDVHAKDTGSYAIAVSTSLAEGNFGRAVLDLKNMTDLGLYPETRHLGEWAALSGQ